MGDSVRKDFVAVIAFSVLAALEGCASSGVRNPDRTSPDRISSGEIASSNVSNAYELITRLRPNWLQRGTAPGSISGRVVARQVILVYLDGSKFGDEVSLRSLGISNLKSLQWLDPDRAATILPNVGRDPIAGAIVISTR